MGTNGPPAPDDNRRSTRREATRGRLLKAAFQIFATHGYAQATIDMIAEAAGLSKGAVYFHFASKEEVFLTVLWSRLHADEQRLRSAVSSQSDQPTEPLLRQVIAYLWLDPRDATWPPLLIEFWSHAGRNDRVREAVGAVVEHRRHALSAVLSAAVDANVIRPHLPMQHCTDMLLTFGDGLVVRTGSGQPRPSPDALVSMIAYLLGVGIEPADQNPRSNALPPQLRSDAPSRRDRRASAG
ncbi:MAG: TetR/AcrR family transcriptional regulator [Dehalococcoidia bacterium]